MVVLIRGIVTDGVEVDVVDGAVVVGTKDPVGAPSIIPSAAPVSTSSLCKRRSKAPEAYVVVVVEPDDARDGLDTVEVVGVVVPVVPVSVGIIHTLNPFPLGRSVTPYFFTSITLAEGWASTGASISISKE